MFACWNGHTDIVQLLLDSSESKNIDFYSKDYKRSVLDKDFDPFINACRFGHRGVVQLLLNYSESKDIDPNAKTACGRNGFMYACLNGHINVVQLLLDYSESKDIELNGDRRTTSFMWVQFTLGQETRARVMLVLCSERNVLFSSKS